MDDIFDNQGINDGFLPELVDGLILAEKFELKTIIKGGCYQAKEG